MPLIETPCLGSVFCVAFGEGEPAICFIHGATTAHQLWNKPVHQLRDMTYVVALDLPGHGRSKGISFPFIEAYSAAIITCLDKLGLQKVVLAGHSMGGAIALWSALSYPQRVAGLVLTSTGSRLPVLPALFDYLHEDNIDEFAAVITMLSYGPSATQEMHDIAKAIIQQTSKQVLLNDLCACNHYNSLARLHEVSQPTLLLCGDQDKVTPLKFSRTLLELIPNAQLEVVPDAGHMLIVEKPEAVSDHIREWYRNHFG